MDKENRVCQLFCDLWSNNGLTWDVKQIGWKHASTFPGFCEKHDGVAFVSIENELFSATSRQCFLVGYRAICYELQRKLALEMARPQSAELLRYAMGSEPPEHRDFHFGAITAKNEFEIAKHRLDEFYLEDAWERWESVALFFDGPLEVVAAGSTTPEYDFGGARRQNLDDNSRALSQLTVGFAEAEEGFALVFGWLRGNTCSKAIAESLCRQAQDSIPGIVVQFLFCQLENVFFRSEWWADLAPHAKDVILGHAQTLTEDRPPAYSSYPFARWHIREIKWV